MPSKRTEPRSIATQLVLLFTLCAVLLLSCSLGLFYWIVVRHATEEDTAALVDKVFAVQADLKQPDGLNAIIRELNNAVPGKPIVYWVRIVGPEQKLIAETPGMENLLPSKIFAAPQPTGLFRLSPLSYKTGAYLFAVIAVSAVVDGQSYVVQIAQDRSEDDRFRRQFRTLFGFVLGVGVIAATVIAVSVTRRGLRPLTEMRRSLERVQPAHLNERIEPGHWPRELQPMAVSFDAMLARLEDSFNRLSQFSADLAHELRTPIGNMLGEAQVSLTRKRTPDEYRAVIESSAAECERLSGIIDNLLFLARSESAEQQISRSLFGARPAIEKVVSFYQTLAEDRHVEIVCDGEAEIFADPILFNRVISNLIDNALRFTPENGSIRIAIRTIANGVEVSMTDTGSGIEPEHLPRVFDRFYRADLSRSSAGTGLGLSLVKSIVDLHGGSSAIESQFGHGTTVTLIFPKQ
ncbi:MAG: heavy metal sensor histidine kinase [Verrucomicrobia bacterium]|nr:heavy metal sensor histidine kinase [Verrucomicrobiota bacterium]